MKRYEAYKDSGVEWLDNIPVNWNTTRIKYLAQNAGSLFIDGDWIESKVMTDEGIRYITTGNVKAGYYSEQGSGYISEETFSELNCTEVFEGDLLISRLNLPIGRACIIPNLNNRIVTSVDNVILRPDQSVNKLYLLFLFSCKKYFEHTELIARGATMQRISRGLLGNIKIPLPSTQEQQTIANYLNRKTSEIDSLVEKKKHLIALLQEECTAIINQAVTKGIDPNIKLKDSGIEWIGEIPECWEVKKLKHLAKICNGKDQKQVLDDEGKYPVYGTGGVFGKANEFLYDKPSVLLGRKGTIDKPQLVEEPFWTVDTAYYTVVSEGVDVNYFYYLCTTINFDLYKYGSAVPSMTQGHLNEIKFAVPNNIDEQIKVANYIKAKTTEINDVIFKTKQEIELMQEYKTALISEVVTGKVDVREEVVD